MDQLKETRSLVLNALENLDLSGSPAELYDPISYILQLWGKRIRPSLVLLGSRLFNGSDQEAIPAALAIELFHNFSLIHDDIMDEAPLRRGKMTVHEKWNTNIAILSGDALFVKSYQQLENLPSDKIGRVLGVFNHISLLVCEGQQFDMNFEKTDNVSLADYLKMIEYKTSALLGGALQIGGILGNASDEDIAKLYTIGRNIGLAFQLKDDLLDAFGNQEKVGKKPGGDIAANKKTILYILAKVEANSDQTRILNQHYGKPNDKDIQVVLDLFTALKLDTKVESLMNDYYEEANKLLDDCGTNIAANQALRAIANQLMVRDH